jgi:polycystin 1L2
MRIWHDNSGQSENASWFLKFVIVRDLQTNKKFYFVCEKWLAVEKEDGKIERLILVASEDQQKQFKYLLEKQYKQKFADGHLWFSIFGRPANSSFTRIERVTCVFVLLYLSMLMDILYFGADDSPSTGGLQIGPLLITTQQVCSNKINFFRYQRLEDTKRLKKR